MEENKRIIFDLSGGLSTIEVIEKILKTNGLEESSHDFFRRHVSGKEPRKIIVQDAALALFEKKIPEKKLAEFLAKHLETSMEVAEKIVKDIKEKLIPFAKIIDLDEQKREEMKKQQEDSTLAEASEDAVAEKEKKETFSKAKEELLKKVGASTSTPEPTPQATADGGVPHNAVKNPVKKVSIANVEENAKQIRRIKKDLNPPADQAVGKPTPEGSASSRSFERVKEKLAENKSIAEKKGPDDYREKIE